jgi:hypothetical protein
MPALDRLSTTGTDAAVDVELPRDRLAGNLGLVLLIDVSFVDVAAALGTFIRQGCFQSFVDLLRPRGRSVAMLAMLATGFAARSFGMFFGRILGERGGLPFGRALQRLELSQQLGDASFEFRDAAFQNKAIRTGRLGHAL